MNRKILILSSDKTGHGHESIVQSLKDQFSEFYSDAEIRVINGFNIGGPIGRFVEQLYFPLVKYTPCLWKFFFQLTSRFPIALDHITSMCIRRSFVRAVREFQPDIIVSVHPAFVGSVNNLLGRFGFNIPFVVVVADLVTVSSLWADTRTSFILSPTDEVKSALQEYGSSEYKIKVLGFPVRKRFTVQREHGSLKGLENSTNSPLKLLVFANAFNKKKTVSIVNKLLDSFDCTITLITGRDDRLKQSIESKLSEKAGERLVLPGYVVNMEHYMNVNDMLITKAGPNILMEAVHCGIPVIITGSLPGQEEGTPEWIVNQDLGAISHKPEELIATINNLLENDRYLLEKIASAQLNYKNRNAAGEIVKFISEYSVKNEALGDYTCLEQELSTL